MFSAANQQAVNDQLLTEVANSAAFQGSALWIYGALGLFALTCLIVGYIVARVIDAWNASSRPSGPSSVPAGSIASVRRIALAA